MEYFEIKKVAGRKKIACRLYNKSTDKLVVLLNGLRAKNKTDSIFYNRLSWVSDIPYSCVYISDPTLLNYPSLRGGYYQGDSDWFGIEYLSETIIEIAKMINVSEENIIVYGSSQGGFAALGVKSYLRNVRVLAECPQSDLSILTSPLSKTDRINMLKMVYGKNEFCLQSHSELIKTSIIHMYNDAKVDPANVFLLVKETDTIHIRDHIIPLIKAFPKISYEVIDGELGEGGHTAIDRSIVVNKISIILEDSLN